MTPQEIAQVYQIRRMTKEDQCSSFDCGDEDLNDFILNEAIQYLNARLAVTYLIETKETKRIAGFFSLANDRVSLSDFESKTEFNRFRKKKFVNEKRIKSYPALKICRLGIASWAKGQSLGTFILDFVKSFTALRSTAGCRFLTVDAYYDAIAFYLKNSFQPLCAETESDSTRLLYFDLDELQT